VIQINPNLLITTPIEGGYSWTLTTRLGHILRSAETQYGKRDPSYTILGIEFSEDGPQIWYPGNCDNIAIQLSLDCLNDEVRACYQLAHECVHLLSPTGARNATVLEEGLATYHSRIYLRENFALDWSAGIQSYNLACSQVEELLAVDQNAIKRLREKEPTISHISADIIVSLYPQFSKDLAQALEQKFTRMG